MIQNPVSFLNSKQDSPYPRCPPTSNVFRVGLTTHLSSTHVHPTLVLTLATSGSSITSSPTHRLPSPPVHRHHITHSPPSVQSVCGSRQFSLLFSAPYLSRPSRPVPTTGKQSAHPPQPMTSSNANAPTFGVRVHDTGTTDPGHEN